MHYETVKVVKDPVAAVYSRSVPGWVIPILAFIFDDTNVQPQGVFTLVDREYPDAAVEYDRLEKEFGADEKNGIPYVVAVYGPGQRGVQALRTAIESWKRADAEREQDGSAPTRQLADVPELVAKADPLLH